MSAPSNSVPLGDGTMVKKFKNGTLWRFDPDGKVIGLYPPFIQGNPDASYPHWVEKWITIQANPEATR